MCVVLIQTKKGVFLLFFRSMKSIAPSTISSSIVSIRFFVSGPVSLMDCLPLRLTLQWRTPRGPNRSRNLGYCSGSG